MSTPKDLVAYAHRLATDCIADWAHEDRGEHMAEWDLSPTQMDEVVRLAQSAQVTIPTVNQFDAITSTTASHILFQFRAGGGYPAGGFVTSILDAFSKADPENFARLAAGFPGYAQAWGLAQSGDYDQLRAIAMRAED